MLGGKGRRNFVPANPVENPLPAVAGRPAQAKTASAVEMEARIDRRGNVVSVKVLNGDNRLASASAKTLYRWRFSPARQDGEPVDSEMLVRFEFAGAAN
jgi:protein TonB